MRTPSMIIRFVGRSMVSHNASCALMGIGTPTFASTLRSRPSPDCVTQQLLCPPTLLADWAGWTEANYPTLGLEFGVDQLPAGQTGLLPLAPTARPGWNRCSWRRHGLSIDYRSSGGSNGDQSADW